MSIHEVLAGTRQWWIEEGDAGAVLAGLPEGCAAFVHADPPWQYFRSAQGAASSHYDGLENDQIAAHLNAAYAAAGNDAYLCMWCTFPKLAEWIEAAKGELTWRYLTGGSWHKDGGLGVGYHLRGDAELYLLYAKGAPKPGITLSNAQHSPRPRHSFKPESILDRMVRLATQPGDLVLDVYAGNSGNLARVCQRLGRRYIGVEIDSKRRTEALVRLSQQELELVG